jgi:O-antigen/teichoic acid export membrane protein
MADGELVALTSSEREAEDRHHGGRGAGTNFLTLAGQTSLLLFYLLGARLYGPAVWGAYAFGLSILEICARLGLAGSDKGILIFVAARRSTGDAVGVDRAIATGLRLSLMVGPALALGMVAISWWVGDYYDQPSFGRSLRFLAAAVPMVTLTTVLLAGTMATKTLRYNLMVRGVTEPVLRVSLLAVLALGSTGIAALTLVHVAAAAGTLAVAIWAFGRIFPLLQTARNLFSLRFDGAIVRQSLPLAAAEFVNSFLAQANVLILGKFRPVEEVGIYAACLALGTAVSVIRGAFDTVLAPVLAEAWVQKDLRRLSSNVKLYSQMVLLFAVPLCGLLLVGGPALLALYGPAYVRGMTTLSLLALGYLLNAALGLTGWVLLASSRSRLLLLNNVVALALNVGLCLVLIPRYGMQGAALAAALAILALHVIQSMETYLIARTHPLSRGFLRSAVLGTLVVGGELLVYRMLGGNPLLRAGLLTVVGTAIFFGLAWALGSSGERAMLRGMLRRGRPAAAAKGNT